MTLHETRRQQLKRLIDRQFGGVSARLAAEIDRQPSYVSRIFAVNPRHRRDMGEKLARWIERRCNLPSGWMDSTDPGGAAHLLSAQNLSSAKVKRLLELFAAFNAKQQDELLDAMTKAVRIAEAEIDALKRGLEKSSGKSAKLPKKRQLARAGG